MSTNAIYKYLYIIITYVSGKYISTLDKHSILRLTLVMQTVNQFKFVMKKGWHRVKYTEMNSETVPLANHCHQMHRPMAFGRRKPSRWHRSLLEKGDKKSEGEHGQVPFFNSHLDFRFKLLLVAQLTTKLLSKETTFFFKKLMMYTLPKFDIRYAFDQFWCFMSWMVISIVISGRQQN